MTYAQRPPPTIRAGAQVVRGNECRRWTDGHALFGQIWRRLSDEQPAPPNPADLNRSGGKVLLGAGLQGLVFGVVKAAVDRLGARGYSAIADDELVSPNPG